MSYVLGARSLRMLQDVHPQLVRVVKRAIQISPQDFMVIEGVRSRDQCWSNWGKGHTVEQCLAAGVPVVYAKPQAAKVTWLRDPLNSRHCIQPDGYGHAVDLAPYPLDWNDPRKFDAIAAAMRQAAGELGVTVRWGADWDNDGKPRERGESDSPHFEL